MYVYVLCVRAHVVCERDDIFHRFNINIYFLNKKYGKSVFSEHVQKITKKILYERYS